MGLGIVGAPATVPTLDAAEGVAPEKQCLHGLIVRYWQAAYDGQRDVTGRAGLMVSRTAPVHEGQTGMLHPPARVAAYNSEVSWVVPTRVIRPKPL